MDNAAIGKKSHYKKYESGNPLKKALIAHFLRQVFGFISLSNDKLVIDIGCGEGYAIQKLASKDGSLRFIGVDLDFNSLRLSRIKNPSASFMQADILNLPFKNNSIPMLMCLETLEHVPDDPEKAFEEIRRVSNNNVIISVPNEPFFTLASLASGKHLRYFGRDPGHKHGWAGKNFRNLLRRYFKIIGFKRPFPWVIALARNG